MDLRSYKIQRAQTVNSGIYPITKPQNLPPELRNQLNLDVKNLQFKNDSKESMSLNLPKSGSTSRSRFDQIRYPSNSPTSNTRAQQPPSDAYFTLPAKYKESKLKPEEIQNLLQASDDIVITEGKSPTASAKMSAADNQRSNPLESSRVNTHLGHSSIFV